MSIQAAPKYKPTATFFSAALHLSEARIDEISSMTKSEKQMKEYEDWYLDKIDDQYTILADIAIYPQCRQPSQLKEKIDGLRKRCLHTKGCIQQKLATALYQRVSEYTTNINQLSDTQLIEASTKIRKIIQGFAAEIDDCETTDSEKTAKILMNAGNLLGFCLQMMEKRFDALSHIEKGPYYISTPTHLSMGQKLMAPAHRPSKSYCLVKAKYRKVYIEELGLCLNYQKNLQKYTSWFENQLTKQSQRIDTMEKFTAYYNISIPNKIAECRTALKKIEDQYRKKLTECQSTNSCLPSSSPSCRRFKIVL
jgi:hypothetical protein